MSSLLILFTILSMYTSINFAQHNKCHISGLENNLKALIGYYGYEDQRWPENNEEVTEWCRSTRRDKINSKNFTLTCLKGMSRSIISVSIYAAEKFPKLACKNKQERQDLISRGKCGNKGKKDTIACWNRLITHVTNAKKLSKHSDKIPTMCCSFYDWRDCTLESYRRVGNKICTESMIDKYFADINRYSIDPLNLLCSDFDESDKCDKYKDKFDRSRVPIIYKSPFPAVIDLLESL